MNSTIKSRWITTNNLTLLAIVSIAVLSCSSGVIVQKSKMNIHSVSAIKNGGLSTIIGTVSDKDSSSMGGTNIYLIDKSGKIKKEAFVGMDNIFKISDIPAGQYILKSSMIGYAAMEYKYIELTSSSSIIIDIVLVPQVIEGCNFPVKVAP